MRTHYHLLLETPKENLVEGMKWLQATFTQRHNTLHSQWGHLFQGRKKSKEVDSDPAYFRTAGLYILLKSVEAGLIDLRKKNQEAMIKLLKDQSKAERSIPEINAGTLGNPKR